jgi:DNA-binding NarL/FixJ family response regulator
MITVLIADDHPLLRHGLASVIAGYPEIQVLGEASNAAEALVMAKELHPMVILMDLLMPGGGAAATATLRRTQPECKVIALTASEADEDLFEAMRAGAKGYLLKYVDTDELVAAIRTVAMGEFTIYPSMASKLMLHLEANRDQASRPQVPSRDDLSLRELEVLSRVAIGARNTEIASQLHIAESTVKAHLRNIMDKLRVKNRAQAVSIAHSLGLIKN